MQTLTVVFTPSGQTGAQPVTRTVVLTVNRGALTVQAADASRAVGQSNPPLTATITGVVNSDVMTAFATTAATSASPAGSYAIVPQVSGTNVGAYDVKLVNGTLKVAPGGAVLTLVSDKPTTYVGDTVTFTAAVVGAGPSPTGTFEFFNGTTSLGGKPLVNNGAVYSTSSLAAGGYSFTVRYSGDANYQAQTSAVAVETIFTSDYTMVVNPATLTIKRGQMRTAVFTVTPTGTFHDTIIFSCGTLPAHISCTFAPPSVTPNGAPVSSTLTINTNAEMAAMERPRLPWQATGGGALAAGMMLCFFRRRRLQLPRLLLLLFVVLCTLGGVSGCGTDPPATATGSYPIVVNAGAGAGNGSHSVNFTVNVVD